MRRKHKANQKIKDKAVKNILLHFTSQQVLSLMDKDQTLSSLKILKPNTFTKAKDLNEHFTGKETLRMNFAHKRNAN